MVVVVIFLSSCQEIIFACKCQVLISEVSSDFTTIQGGVLKNKTLHEYQ